ncbi:hypothetical protein SAMN05660772_02724 [Pasteurella testudinis DSM 23072]|uniref:Uncharacterized protein n=1 Tax=Pasteurella testudinis DSM 23072 TaxID=1122938 RepID=A0A1W1V235_9PAST|nr:hypothetical protein [Pasteurella testudinis]SMB87346.1 hypothetical protein SAMN05660772_02724 [Pasteurella testudinis DSM 23072]SUB51640.1 Uncharacterised protein [Pasteurella testudinis]
MTFERFLYATIPTEMAKSAWGVIKENRLEQCSLAEQKFILDLWIEYEKGCF